MSTESKDLFVCIRLGGGEYGIDIHSVQEIIRKVPVTAVPGGHTHVRGAMNLRGTIIPVVDPRGVFAIPEGPVTGNQERIVILRVDGKLVGMEVDAVTEVLKIPQEEVRRQEANPQDMGLEGMAGFFSTDDRLIILLDPGHLRRTLFPRSEEPGSPEPERMPETTRV
jgi:purine-binding chemotaxis protein CheW